LSIAPRACCSASSNLFLLEASHAFSYSILAFDGTFNLATLTVVDRTAANFHGKQLSSSAVGPAPNVEFWTRFTDGLPSTPKLGEYLVFCAHNGMTEIIDAKPQNSARFQLKTADTRWRSGFGWRPFRARVITLEQGLPGDLRAALIQEC
jgi:hypothetical protein